MKSKYGFYKVSTANFFTHVGNVKENENETIKLINKAIEENINVLVFPELSLVGYTAQDLFFHEEIYQEELRALENISKVISSKMVVFVGGIFPYLDKLYDVAFVLSKDKILAIIPKSYLPNYNEFYEKRWFSAGFYTENVTIKLLNQEVPFGKDIILDAGEMKIGVEICEDLWVINPPSNSLCLNGANVIVNLSASNEYIGKKAYRKELVKIQSAKNYCAYIYSSAGFGESSQDLVFSGHQIIASSGAVLNESYDKKGLTEALIDIDKIKKDRIKFKSSFECEDKNKYRYISCLQDEEIDLLPERYDAYPFIVKDTNERRKRSLEIISLQAKGLATRLINTGFKNVVIGLSGGLDSTLALVATYEAYKIAKLDFKGIHVLTLPGFATSALTFKNVVEFLKVMDLSYTKIDISDLATKHLNDLKHPLNQYDVTYENTQARIRTLYLMDYANMVNGLVIGTGDLSESALGFSTYNGDHMSMYAVNVSVPKTLIKVLLEDYAYEHKEFQEVVKQIIETPISPELIPSNDKSIKQKTESIIGKYDLHDFFLYNFQRNCFSKEKIYALAKIAFKDIDPNYIKSTLDIFMKRFFTQQFKRSCIPDGPKVGSVSLSPRGDLRLASDLSFENTINKKID